MPMPRELHGEDNVDNRRRTLVLLLVINAMMFFLELVAGVLANSTALLADSLDMFADAAVYGIALYAAGKPHHVKRRAAFVTGILQAALGLVVTWQVVRHFLHGREPASLVMILVGATALTANVSCLWLLRKERRGQVHIRATWIFTKTDTLANLGTMLGGGLVLATRSALPDLIVGAAISLLVLLGGVEIIRDAVADRLPEQEPRKSKTWDPRQHS